MCVQQEKCWKQPSHFAEIHLAFPFALPMCFSQWICHFIFAVTNEFEILKWSLTKCLGFLTSIKILSGRISNQWYFLSGFLGNMQTSRKHLQMCQLQASQEIWWVWCDFSHCFADRFTVVMVVWISLSKLCTGGYCSVRWNSGVSERVSSCSGGICSRISDAEFCTVAPPLRQLWYAGEIVLISPPVKC